MRILGIDPGYERLGIAVLEKTASGREGILFSECFKTSTEAKFPERLKSIGVEVKGVIKKWKPRALAIETLFLHTNQKTAMRVAEARGVCIYESKMLGLEVIELSPLEVKLAVSGNGRADKKQMKKMLRLLLPESGEISSDDELDAVAVALGARPTAG